MELNYIIIEYLHDPSLPPARIGLPSRGQEDCSHEINSRARVPPVFDESPSNDDDDESLADGEVPCNMSFYGSLLEINLSECGGVGGSSHLSRS